jgi:hypothetical protein
MERLSFAVAVFHPVSELKLTSMSVGSSKSRKKVVWEGAIGLLTTVQMRATQIEKEEAFPICLSKNGNA